MPAVLRRCPPSCHVASKAPVLGSKNWPRSYSSAVSTRNWLVGTEENRSSKKKAYTTSITRFRDTSASHFPALPHRLLQLWLYRRETCGFRPGMAIRVRMRLSGGIAAGFQGLLCSCLFSPDHCSNQQSLRVKLWFYENMWSVILRPSGNACSAQCCRQSPSQSSP